MILFELSDFIGSLKGIVIHFAAYFRSILKLATNRLKMRQYDKRFHLFYFIT